MSKINCLSPFDESTNEDNFKEQILDYLQGILSFDNLIQQKDIKSIDNMGSARSFQVLTLKDGSKWVMGDKGIQRIAGSKHLEETLKEIKGDLEGTWKAVETKYILQTQPIKCSIDFAPKSATLPLLNSTSVISVSKYEGDNRPEFLDNTRDADKAKITNESGYEDFTLNTNQRVVEDSTVIIDTEYSSFNFDQSKPVSDYAMSLVGQEFEFTMQEILF